MLETYLVTLKLRLGAYEKTSRHLIEAGSEEQAQQTALENESHNDSAGYDGDGDWWDDTFIYEVYDCQLLPWDDAVTLRKYL